VSSVVQCLNWKKLAGVEERRTKRKREKRRKEERGQRGERGERQNGKKRRGRETSPPIEISGYATVKPNLGLIPIPH